NITGDLEKEEGELSVHPEVHSGEGIADSHVLLNGDTVLEPVVKATDHDYVLHHASKQVSKQVSVAEMSRGSPEVPVRDSSEGGGRSFISGPWSLEWLNDHKH
ncbi:hypothetical protein A2U01_0058092, partial [Trifolium medium]|nr:hypothetical protein [Trifolium medium]